MQTDLEAEFPGEFQLIGINGIGFESSNSLATDGRTIPWLQDVASQDVWTKWAVEYRDVIIVGADLTKRDVYNLTTHDLGQAEFRAALKQKLLDAR
ncbi:MAG: hypothetical protein ACO1OB_07330 [Archangium sp.]